MAPVLPGLTESQVVPLLERAAAAGAISAFMILLRLPAEVLPVFTERIDAGLSPERVRHIWSSLRELRDGRENVSTFGGRMTGQGPRWEVLERTFNLACRRLGLNATPEAEPATFSRPGQQLSLL